MRRRGGRLVATEAALAVVTAAAVLGMHRLFDDGSYRGSLLVEALAAHVVVAVLRRQGVRLLPAAAVTAGAAACLLAWSIYPETTSWLLPTGSTVGALGRDLSAAWEVFGEVRAPAPVEDGFLVAGSAAVCVIAYLADWAAFQVAATFEALLSSATLFLFAAALGAAGGRVPGATVYAAAALAFVLVHPHAAPGGGGGLGGDAPQPRPLVAARHRCGLGQRCGRRGCDHRPPAARRQRRSGIRLA